MSRLQAALTTLLLFAVLPMHSAAQGPAAPTLPAGTMPAGVPAGHHEPMVDGDLDRSRLKAELQRPAADQPSWRQDFEGPTTSWTEAGGDAQYSLVAHQRVRGAAHSGQGSEWFQVAGQGGSTVLVAHDIGRPWVIDELRPSIWIFADRPGIQFYAEVTLPRSLDPRSQKPLAINVFGTAYSTVGRWQRLEIVDIPRMVARQVRVLRSQLAVNVDDREAFVSRVLLNIYGGPGVTNVWTDDLEVFGHVPSVASNAAPGAPPGAAIAVSPVGLSRDAAVAAVAGGPDGIGRQDAYLADPRQDSLAAPGRQDAFAATPRREVKLALGVLKINDYPIFPRCVEYRGEHLAFLKQLGFNTVWLRQVPSPAILSEARQLGMWLVCPPPESVGNGLRAVPSDAERHDPQAGTPRSLQDPPASNAPLTIGPEFEPVLVWDLGHGLTGESLDANRQRAEQVQLADAQVGRPLICAPVNNLRSYSRHIDLLLIDRRPLGTSLEMPDYGTWVRRQPLLAVPGTPVWTTVQTQTGEGLRRQFAMLTPGQAPSSVVGPEQIRLLVYTAISSGSRGLLFLSDSSLEAPDDETRQRAMTLELLNLELQTIEPWAAGGNMVATAECSQPLVSGAILRDDRARIVMPMWLAPGSQCVTPLAAADPLVLTLPGVPESSNFFELFAGRLQPLRHRREAGGTQVTLDEFGLSAWLFLAEDPTIIEAVSRRAVASGKQIAELEAYLAAQKLDTTVRVLGQIGGHMPPQTLVNPAKELDIARQNLQLCDARLRSGDYAMASICARRAMSPLRRLERAAWETAMNGLGSPVAIPGTSTFQALPWYWALVNRTAAMRPGPNRLPGGDFENLDLWMLRDGWRHFQNSKPGIRSAVDLVKEATHSGRQGLRLTARADDPEHPPAIIEMPPLWVTSPAVPVEAGQIVRIHGWVNIPTAITGSVDGLQVVESLTGEEMALRLDKTQGWQEFTMLRIVPQSGPMMLTLWMTGLGEVRLDDLTIEVLEPNGVR